jgi:hypothetical protein
MLTRDCREVFMTFRLAIASLALAALPCAAQFKNGQQTIVLDLPLQSQRAVVTQRIGLTDLTITYHRPLVNGRKLWGAVVPYGQVWRAGANENTTIEFTDPVLVDGKPLAKGTYGLHMIPAPENWTIIFSKDFSSWGSFTYDEKNDALRINVKPHTTDLQEALVYDFDPITPDSAVVNLKWERIAVPFKVSVNTREVALASVRRQLRGLAQYDWQAWNDAALYLLENDLGSEEALQYADRSIQNEERFDNLSIKAQILAAMNRPTESAAVRNRAFELAVPLQLHNYARQLQAEGKQEEAFAVFRLNAKKNPAAWFTHVGLARMYSGTGDFANAVKEIKLALAATPDAQKKQVENLLRRLEKKEDINKL